jgi:hypothetical protein
MDICHRIPEIKTEVNRYITKVRQEKRTLADLESQQRDRPGKKKIRIGQQTDKQGHFK